VCQIVLNSVFRIVRVIDLVVLTLVIRVIRVIRIIRITIPCTTITKIVIIGDTIQGTMRFITGGLDEFAFAGFQYCASRDVCSECNAWKCSSISGVSGIATSRAESSESSSSGSHMRKLRVSVRIYC
jgi:hypothetical protein